MRTLRSILVGVLIGALFIATPYAQDSIIRHSSTNAWGAACDGAGANHVLCYYNGTSWTVAGK